MSCSHSPWTGSKAHSEGDSRSHTLNPVASIHAIPLTTAFRNYGNVLMCAFSPRREEGWTRHQESIAQLPIKGADGVVDFGECIRMTFRNTTS